MLVRSVMAPWIAIRLKEVSNCTMDNCHAVKVSNGIMDDNQANRGKKLHHG